MLKFRCGQCNQKMGVPDEYAGKRVRCPKCKNAQTVPQPVVELEPPVQPVRPVSPSVIDSVVTSHAPPNIASIFAENTPAGGDALRHVATDDLWNEPFAQDSAPRAAPKSDKPHKIEAPQAMTAEVIDAPARRRAAGRSSEDEVRDLLRDLRQNDEFPGEPPPVDTDAPSAEFDPHPSAPAQASTRADSSSDTFGREPTRASPGGKFSAFLGLCGIVLGLAAVALCWRTGAAKYAAPVGVAGLLLALIGVAIATARNAGVGIASVGTVVAAVGIAVPVLGAYGVVPLPGRVRVPVAGSTAVVNVSMPAGQAPAVQAGAQAPADGFVPATSPVVLGDVQVLVSSVRIVRPAVHDGHWNALRSLDDKRLVISLELRNVAATGHVVYRTWAAAAAGQEPVSLTDGAGNLLKPIDLAPLVPVGRVSEDSVGLYAGRAATPDVLIFEKPVSTLHDLKLQLPGANIGTPGATLRIRIPAQIVQY